MGAHDGDTGEFGEPEGSSTCGGFGARPAKLEIGALGVGGRVMGGVGGTSPVMCDSDCAASMSIDTAPSGEIDVMSQLALSKTKASSDL